MKNGSLIKSNTLTLWKIKEVHKLRMIQFYNDLFIYHILKLSYFYAHFVINIVACRYMCLKMTNTVKVKKKGDKEK